MYYTSRSPVLVIDAQIAGLKYERTKIFQPHPSDGRKCEQ